MDDAVIVAVDSWYDVVGAATLLNTGVFQKIAEAMDSDLYVAPYTTTEVLVFRASPDKDTLEEQEQHIEKVVKLINEDTIPEALFLSKNLYLFEKDTSRFILV